MSGSLIDKIKPLGRTVIGEFVPIKQKIGNIMVPSDVKTRVNIWRIIAVGPGVPDEIKATLNKNVIISSFHGIPIDFPESGLTKEKFRIFAPDEVIAIWEEDYGE